MFVLGIHEGHDSSAAIVKDGEIIADVQEERFARVKHYAGAPVKSIGFCMQEAGISGIHGIDAIGISGSRTPPGLRALFLPPVKQNTGKRFVKDLAKSLLGVKSGDGKLKQPVYYPDYSSFDSGRIRNYDHHLAHAASAYFTQPENDRHLVFTIDGAGDQTCTAIWLAEKSSISLLRRYYREASIGWAYSIVTEGLHWIHGDGEGKTMGLAPYGDCTGCRGVLDRYFPVFEKNRLVRESEPGTPFYWLEKGANQFHFDAAREVEQLVREHGRENIAAEAQRKLEDAVINLVEGWIEETGIRKVCFAGGVMLNVKLNQRIWNQRAGIGLEKQHIYPNPGDSGLAVGAALLEYYRHHEFRGMKLQNLYWGPEYSNDYIKQVLDIRKLKYEYVENPSEAAARLLAGNKIVAWFQGRMESGPRALGNRSILMSPLHAENKDILNANVKFREGFRPFCPSLCSENRDIYLEDNRDEFFMITSFDVKEEKRRSIPAVVHVDGTVRPQMVQREQNERFWDLIHAFGRLTGESILLNTSFNVMGEPIINNPEEALRCFFSSGIDSIFIGNYYLDKEKL